MSVNTLGSGTMCCLICIQVFIPTTVSCQFSADIEPLIPSYDIFCTDLTKINLSCKCTGIVASELCQFINFCNQTANNFL